MNSPRRKTPQNRPSGNQNNTARIYDRMAQLPGLIGLWPSEIQDRSAVATLKILALLRRALRSERARGRAGHWTYDLNRHLALAESLKAERAHLRSLEHFPAKRTPVCVAKMRPNKEIEPRPIQSERKRLWTPSRSCREARFERARLGEKKFCIYRSLLLKAAMVRSNRGGLERDQFKKIHFLSSPRRRGSSTPQ